MSGERQRIWEIINIALEKIEDANKSKLEGVFRNIDFNSEGALGQTKDRNRRLKNLLEDFADSRLDLRPSIIGNRDVIGDVYEFLIGQFAAGAGKKAGEFYTPPEVSTLLAKLVQPKPGDRICDPACGSGSLLIRVAKETKSQNYFLGGQESNGSTWALCRMNMFLHDMDGAQIEWCDTISNPRLLDRDELMRFNVVVANPPFSLKKWGAEFAANDPYTRFYRGYHLAVRVIMPLSAIWWKLLWKAKVAWVSLCPMACSFAAQQKVLFVSSSSMRTSWKLLLGYRKNYSLAHLYLLPF